MRKETIELLKSIRLGEHTTLTKPLDDIDKEKTEVISKLFSLDILSKDIKGYYRVKNNKLLLKFIQLQDFEKLIEYIESENIKPSVTYNYNKGILIQDSSFNNSKVLNKIKKPPTPKPIKKKPISERLIDNWWVLLVTVVGGVIVLAIQYKWFR